MEAVLNTPPEEAPLPPNTAAPGNTTTEYDDTDHPYLGVGHAGRMEITISGADADAWGNGKLVGDDNLVGGEGITNPFRHSDAACPAKYAVRMNADAGPFGLGGTSWKEEVLLHDGNKIIVERNMTRHGRHEPGRKPPIGDQRIGFIAPGTSQKLMWRDDYSDDVGSVNFTPIALHILNGSPYIIAADYGCLSYNKWGRPNPPYVIFKHDGTVWQRIPIAELPDEFRTINLVIAPSNEEKTLDRLGTVPIAEIDKLNQRLVGLHYRAIVREALAARTTGVSCEELVCYKGAWVGPGDSIGKRMMDRRAQQRPSADGKTNPD